MKIFLSILLTLAFGIAPAISNAQETNSAREVRSRPKIGLVLSGGGARGFAHIGVIEWFEEHHIPVDYIAGTSMGGLVAGMYATGMTPAEMRTFILNIDWDKVLRGPPSYDELSFRRKEDQRTYPNDIEIGARNGLRLPGGINPGQRIGLIFDRMTLPYSTIGSFDNLPIPFRCVATDMLSAEPVVLKDGSLTESLRATMSIPGVFTPVEMNGRVLADGGLLDNIPTDVMKTMGPDIIIAVNIGTPLGKREDIESLTGMLAQVISVTTIGSDRVNLKLADYVITPDLGSYTSLDFKKGKVIADLGYKGATEQGVPLQKFSLDETEWQQHLAARRARKRTDIPTPVALVVEGVGGQKNAEISRDLRNNVGKPINESKLEKQLNEIRGGGRYESLGYDVTQLDRTPRLRIRVSEKTYGPPLITPVIQVQSNGLNDLGLSAGFRLTNFDVGGHGSELRTDVIVGSRTMIGLEFYRPVGHEGFFIAPRAYYSSYQTGVYVDGHREAEYGVRRGAGALDVGYIFGPRSQLRVGYEIGGIDAKVQTGSSTLPNVDGTLSSGSLRYVFDGQNSPIVPTRGVRVAVDGYWFFKSPGAPLGFPQVAMTSSYFKSITPRGLVFAFGGGGTTFSKVPGPAQQFTVGGPFRLSAFSREEFRGRNFILAGGGYLYRVAYLPTFLGQKIYAGSWYEGGSAFFNRSDVNFRNDVAGGFVVETLLGPMVLGGAYGEGGRGKIFFSLGRLF